MQRHFRKIAKISLVLVYLVITAGAVVRMTGSGMGCPDWPKCFGYYIPPSDASELQWKPDHKYKKGQVIIQDETLKVVKEDFISASNFDQSNWEPYTKHDYAVFNPIHTWVEFINRLFGALAGLATLALALASIYYWRKNKWATILSWLVVLAMAFQAWLGATVVFSVLEPVKITVHMVMALIIVAMLLYLVHSIGKPSPEMKYDKRLTVLLFVGLAASAMQIVLGTQVRQFVDGQIDTIGETGKSLWLNNANWPFYLHRSFSIFVVLLNLFIARRIYRFNLGFSKINWILLILLAEVVSGMAMYYYDFPFASQPVHLVLASLLFGVQFYLVLEALRSKKLACP